MDAEAKLTPNAPSLDSLAAAAAGDGRWAGTRATVFGLDVSADVHLPFLQEAPAAPTGRRFEISLATGRTSPPADGHPRPSADARASPSADARASSAADAHASPPADGHPKPPADAHASPAGWPDGAEIVCDQREPDGSVNFRIEAHPQAGYLIWGPTYGRHLLRADGTRALCIPEECAADAWQRLLIAQVLPFAALLRGLEVFHASAVVVDGRAIAFVGPSRAGKTSVALELCRLGASFLVDDVLALERVGEELLGHPGTPVAGVDHAEAQRLARAGSQLRAEIVATNARERIVRMHGAAAPAPLAALFFLDRRSDGPRQPRFEPAADARALLCATFNSVLTSPQRLRGLLEVCALTARRRVERILLGPGVDAEQLAAAVQRRVGTPA